jgi:hypothetical protein
MKITRQSLLAASTLAIGGFIGASILVAFADSTWTSAPNCSGTTMPCSNVAAPINVSGSAQTKYGSLTINNGNLQVNGGFGIAGGPFVFNNGTAPTPGQALIAQDVSGTIGWGTIGSGSTSGVSSIVAGTNITISPTNGTGSVTVNSSQTGLVGGGCYYTYSYSGGNNIYTPHPWGNSPSCSLCPTNYTFRQTEMSGQISGFSGISGLCIHN